MKIGRPIKKRRIQDLKEGDFITIKSSDQMEFGSYEYLDKKNRSNYYYGFVPGMEKLNGNTFRVKHIVLSTDPKYISIRIEGADYNISPSMCQDFSDDDPLMYYAK